MTRRKAPSSPGPLAASPDDALAHNGEAVAALPDKPAVAPRRQLLPALSVPARRFAGGDLLEVQPAADGWLFVTWSVSGKTLERARSAMGRFAHQHQWILRIHRVERDDSGPRAKSHHADIPVAGHDRCWFLRVPNTEDAWVIELGLVFGENRFFSVMHSVPQTAASSLRTPDELHSCSPAAAGPAPTALPQELDLSLRPELVIRGTTDRHATLQVDDQDVPLDPETGEFEWRTPLTSGRSVVPLVATLLGQHRRALVAVDANIRKLDPQAREG